MSIHDDILTLKQRMDIESRRAMRPSLSAPDDPKFYRGWWHGYQCESCTHFFSDEVVEAGRRTGYKSQLHDKREGVYEG